MDDVRADVIEAVQEILGRGRGQGDDVDQIAMRGCSNGLPNVTDLDLGPEVQLRIRRQVEHAQHLGLRGRDRTHLMHVTHHRLGDPGNLLGVPLLHLATSGVLLLSPPGGGLLSGLVAAGGRLHLTLEARFGVG